MWQALYDELKQHNFMIIAVAMDSRQDAARPWIEQAKAAYVSLIDRDHIVAARYNMVNVPQAAWIDEAGQFVRPPEIAGAYEGFRQMDRATFTTPEEVTAMVADAKKTYLAALKDWVINGADSRHAFDGAQAKAHVAVPSAEIAAAHAQFRLGQYLTRSGRADAGDRHLREAIRLHPNSWNMWRQHAEPAVMGLAAGPDFWERVDQLGSDRYYANVDMEGMP